MKKSIYFYLYLILSLGLGFYIYFLNYDYPKKLFWDENYHIASAHKYLDRVYFQEMHPPLGKLLIALGEKVIVPNKKLNLSQFSKVNKIAKTPVGYSFKGVRFFPALLAALTAPVFFIIIYFLLGNAHLSFLFSCFYFFDNALIVHFRGAMLDGMQMFFILSSLAYFLYLYKINKANLIQWLILGLIIGFAVAIKITSLLLILLPIILLFKFKKLAIFKIFVCSASTLFIYIGSYYIHYNVANNIYKNQTYKTSTEVIELIKTKQVSKLKYLPLLIQTSFKYFIDYQKGVPKLREGYDFENGSHPIFWPIGKRAINYRWEKTQNGGVRYLMLQINPVSWLCSMAGIVFALAYLIAVIFFDLKHNPKVTEYIAIFVALYLLYMAAMIRVDRVMYLYHYFIPYVFGLALFALILKLIFENNYNLKLYSILILLVISCILSFLHFAPLTYYQELKGFEIGKRAWFSFWNYRIVNL